jgi:hypothetical protein
MNGIYADDARVVLIPYILDMIILDAVRVDAVIDDTNACGAVRVDVIMAEINS